MFVRKCLHAINDSELSNEDQLFTSRSAFLESQERKGTNPGTVWMEGNSGVKKCSFSESFVW